ncbi:MAG: hypothetical protein HQK53_14090, partial [Oligoflexia bacterium]|nr:hypothetical protein [Oligoflexia bacterium]
PVEEVPVPAFVLPAPMLLLPVENPRYNFGVIEEFEGQLLTPSFEEIVALNRARLRASLVEEFHNVGQGDFVASKGVIFDEFVDRATDAGVVERNAEGRRRALERLNSDTELNRPIQPIQPLLVAGAAAGAAMPRHVAAPALLQVGVVGGPTIYLQNMRRAHVEDRGALIAQT